HRNAREAAARPSRFGGPIRKLAKERIDQFLPSGRAWEVLQPAHCQLAGMGERVRDQVILAAKVLIERTLGDAGACRDLIHRNPEKTLTPEQPVGCVQDALSCLHCRSPHALPPSMYTEE